MKLCAIAARAGSKGLPGKNVKMFAGRPLLQHTVAQAVASGCFDAVAITSDSPLYLDIAREAGADLLIERPAELASDTISKPPVLRHALEVAEKHLGGTVEVLVDLQPTSPLRRPEDIPGAIDVLLRNEALADVVSVSAAKASPYFTLVEDVGDGRISLSKPRPDKVTRRQDAPPVYELNGSIYVWRREAILQELPAINDRTGYWVMPKECSFDIDTSLDFDIAAFVAHKHFGWPPTE